MATYRVTDPSTGRTLRLTGDSPPTEQELNQIFSSVSGDVQSSPQSSLTQTLSTSAKQQPSGDPAIDALIYAQKEIIGPVAQGANTALLGLPKYLTRAVAGDEYAKQAFPQQSTLLGKTARFGSEATGLVGGGVGQITSKVGGKLIPTGSGLLRKALGGAATGAIGGAITPTENIEDVGQRAINTGAGAVLGGVTPGVTSVAGIIFKKTGEAYKSYKAVSKIDKKIKDIQKAFGLERTDDKYITTKLNEIKKDSTSRITDKSIKYINAANNEIAGLNAQYNKLKDTMVRGKAVDFADFMKKSGPKWVKQGTERYGLTLERFAKSVDDDTPISAEEAYNFVTNNIRNVEVTGIESPVLSYLRGLQGKYQRLYEQYLERMIKVPNDPSYKSGTTWDSIPFKELKAEISGVYNHISPNLKNGRGVDPADVAAMNVARSWSDLLKSKLKPDLKIQFEKLQEQYRPFAEAKTMMGKMFNPYSGELDVNKAIETAEEFALNERNVNVQRLMKFLEEGESGFIGGVEGLKERSSELAKLGSQARAIKETIPVITRSKEVATAIYKKEVAAKVKEIENWQRAYNKLKSERTFNQEKVNSFLKVLGITGVTAGTVGGAVSGYRALQGLK